MLQQVDFRLFFVASWALIVAPGPDLLYVISRGISQGRLAGLFSAAGITLGLLVHTTLAALGLSVLLQTSSHAFAVVKWVGAAYLIILGIKSVRNETGLSVSARLEPVSPQIIFVQGALTNVLNPKVALFFLAFLPQFVTPTGNSTLVLFILGLIFSFWGLLFLTLVGYFSGRFGLWILRKKRLSAGMRWLTGVTLAGLGLRLAFVQRK